MNLFDPLGSDETPEPGFIQLANSPFHAGARRMIEDLYRQMGGASKRFRADFRGKGFHARLFELACFAYLREYGFTIDGWHDRPDFLVSKGEVKLAIEATVASPSDGADRDISVSNLYPAPPDRLLDLARNIHPKRIDGVLTRKTKKSYQALSHCHGRAIVLMVSPLYEAGSNLIPDYSLIEFLMSKEDGFFTRSGTEHISAVLYCPPFGVSRFFRLAPEGLPKGMTVSRGGIMWTKTGNRHFQFIVGEPGAPVETWSEGITLFQNPRAAVKLADDALPVSSVIVSRSGRLIRRVKGFHPLSIFMSATIGKKDSAEIASA